MTRPKRSLSGQGCAFPSASNCPNAAMATLRRRPDIGDGCGVGVSVGATVGGTVAVGNGVSVGAGITVGRAIGANATGGSGTVVGAIAGAGSAGLPGFSHGVNANTATIPSVTIPTTASAA